MENKLVIDQLEEFLMKMQTDIYFFEDYMKNSSNEILRQSFSGIEENLKEQAMSLSYQISKLGGNIVNNINLCKENSMGFNSEISSIGIGYTDNVLSQAYNLANEVIMMGTRLIHENPNLNHDSYRMISLILKTYQRHMNTLIRYSY